MTVVAMVVASPTAPATACPAMEEEIAPNLVMMGAMAVGRVRRGNACVYWGGRGSTASSRGHVRTTAMAKAFARKDAACVTLVVEGRTVVTFRPMSIRARFHAVSRTCRIAAAMGHAR